MALVPWAVDSWNLGGCVWESAFALFPFCWGLADCAKRERVLRYRELCLGHVMVETCLPSYKHRLIYWRKTALNPSAISLAHFSPSSRLSKALLEYLHSWRVPFASVSRDTAPIELFSATCTFRDNFVRNPYFWVKKKKVLLFGVAFFKFEQKQLGRKWEGEEKRIV